MDSQKYNRSIPLNCPTCGGTDFKSSGEEDPLVKCSSCGLELTRDELIARNDENIHAHVEEMKQQVAADLQRELKESLRDAFRGSKNIEIR